MTINQALQKIEKAGFHLAVDGPDIIVNPPGKLSQAQRQFIKDHKAEIMAALLEASPSGNDHPPANDERALIHVPDFAATDGRRYSFDMTVPKANLERLRQVVRFKLIDNQGGGSILGEPGKSRDELVEILKHQYADRLETIEGDSIRQQWEEVPPDSVDAVVVDSRYRQRIEHALLHGQRMVDLKFTPLPPIEGEYRQSDDAHDCRPIDIDMGCSNITIVKSMADFYSDAESVEVNLC